MFKFLGKKRPAVAAVAERLYKPGKTKSATLTSITVTNLTVADKLYSIYISDDGDFNEESSIAWQATVLANDWKLIELNFPMTSNFSVYVESNANLDLNFMCWGNEIGS